MGTGSATSFADVEVSGISVSSKDHAAGSVGDSVVGIIGEVVKDLVDGGSRVFGGSGLLGANSTKGNKKFVLDDTNVEEESTNDALDAKNASGIKGRTGWRVRCVLDLCAIVDLGVLVGGWTRLRGVTSRHLARMVAMYSSIVSRQVRLT